MASHHVPEPTHDITFRGGHYEWVPHTGKAAVQAIELPSVTRVSHRPTLQIQELVAISYGIHPSAMKSRNRDRCVAWPRQVAMYLTRKLTNRSMPSIGAEFGGRHHTTVLHAIRTVAHRMETDPVVAGDVDAFKKALRKVS